MLETLLIILAVFIGMLIACRYRWGRFLTLYVSLGVWALFLVSSFTGTLIWKVIACAICYPIVGVLEGVFDLIPFKSLRSIACVAFGVIVLGALGVVFNDMVYTGTFW